MGLNQRAELEDRYPGTWWLRRPDGATRPVVPDPDLHAPALDDLRPLLAEIGRRLAAGGSARALRRRDRTGRPVAVCVLMEHGIAREALGPVARHRPMAGPEVGAQLQLVDELAAVL